MTIRLLAQLALFAFSPAIPMLYGQSGVVISQIYGGGGNTGATVKNDFIELFNAGPGPIRVDGWSIQYASASGTTWDRTLLSGTVQPGQYYLVQEDQGNAGTVSLPTPDAVGGINLSATAGKVALVSSTSVLSGSSPGGALVVDLVGYGDANWAEGSPAPGLTNTTAAKRASNGCGDSGNNRNDFTAGSPSPRNSRSPLNPCGGSVSLPQITSAGITNAASFATGAVAPGEIVTIFGLKLGPPTLVALQLAEDGRVKTTLGGTRVLFDGIAAPMIYSVADQVSAVVPYAVSSRSSTDVQVEFEARISAPVRLSVVPSAPGIFTLDSTGSGQGAILNQDYRVNGAASPAKRGSVVTVYATGGGQTTPASEDGRVAAAAARQVLTVSARIGGADAEVLYAGAAPGLVSGVLQVNVRVPETAPPGNAVPLVISVGNTNSQQSVFLAVEGAGATQDADPLIEQRLRELKGSASVSPLPELPSDYSSVPRDWLGIVSWNIQVGGTSVAGDAARPSLVHAALTNMFAGTYQMLIAQEIPNKESAALLSTMLPNNSGDWRSVFFETTDTMDNGIWHRTGITLRDAFPLFVTPERDSAGRLVPDLNRTTHPAVVAQFEAGDFDFTLVNVHLTFAEGDTAQSARELRHVLDYLDWYFAQPDHDPDVLVCGDFNIPSALSGQTGRNGVTLDAIFDQDSRFQTGERRFVVTVHQPTSRSSAANGGAPANNYDHCVLSADTMEEFIQARRVATTLLTDHPDDPEERLTSDHFPVVAFFRTKGERVVLDRRRTLRP